MNLPAAAPGYGGGILVIRRERCWANTPALWHGGIMHCPGPVDPDDDLGLCGDCKRSILP